MSAMPERVLTPDTFNRLLGFYRSGRGGEYDAAADTLNAHDTALRAALLAAEARVREVEAELDAIGDEVDAGLHNGALHLLICNGDHHIPLWDVKPGVLCNCPIGQHFKKLHRDLATLRADLKAAQELEQLHLQNLDAAYADLDALVPLARLGLAVLDGGRDLHKAVLASTAHDAAMALVFVDYPVVDGEQIVRFSLDQPTTTQARAILARETNDG